jgi:hypothetical protein
MAAALVGCFTLKGKVLNDIPPVRGWTCSIRSLSGWRFLGGIMETRQKLRAKLHELEKRLNDLEVGFGGLNQMSATLEATLEVFVKRGLIPRREFSRRFSPDLEPDRKPIEGQTNEEYQKLVDSLLDELMESVDDEQMPHA